MDDMGMTFHVISDLKGEVQHKDRIARRLLQLDRVNFPAGILFDGHYEPSELGCSENLQIGIPEP
jgi:hypothetical protein